MSDLDEIRSILGYFINNVPIDDLAVRLHLRLRNQPQLISGEDEYDRRERLKKCFDLPTNVILSAIEIEKKNTTTKFECKGTKELYEARVFFHQYSIKNKVFLGSQAEKLKKFILNSDSKNNIAFSVTDNDSQHSEESDSDVDSVLNMIKHISDNYTDKDYLKNDDDGIKIKIDHLSIINDRALKAICVNEESKIICTGGLNLKLKFIDSDSYKELYNITTDAYVNHIIPLSANKFVVGDNEGKINIYENNVSIAQFLEHELRVNRLEAHPSQNYLFSTSHDESWILWDLNKEEPLLIQNGHESSVYDIKLNKINNYVLITSDFDGKVKIWDIRMGKNVSEYRAHTGRILSLDFHPLYFWEFVSGGQDGAIKFWDLRNKPNVKNIDDVLDNAVYVGGGHTTQISKLFYDKECGRYLLSTDYDSQWRLTNLSNLKVKKVENHECKPPFDFTITPNKFYSVNSLGYLCVYNII